jgi:hypothetical protein
MRQCGHRHARAKPSGNCLREARDIDSLSESLAAIRLEPLGRQHNREIFDCGEPSVRNYLQRVALQAMRVMAGRRRHLKASRRVAIVIDPSLSDETTGAMIDVPSPAPLDLLLSFDAADAPILSRFSIQALEPPLRACANVDIPAVIGGSSGTIVSALSAEALAMRGADVEELFALKQWLVGEGFTVSVATDAADRAMASAELVHVFGAAFESHTIAFGQAALERGPSILFSTCRRYRMRELRQASNGSDSKLVSTRCKRPWRRPVRLNLARHEVPQLVPLD